MKNILLLTSLLLGPYCAALLLNRFSGKEVVTLRFATRAGLALVMAAAGAAHFIQTEEMRRLLPSWVPAAHELILLTGVVELAAVIGLLLPKTARFTAGMLIIYLIAVFPANVWASLNYVEFGGHSLGPAYLLVRGPFQLLLILWGWKVCGRPPR